MTTESAPRPWRDNPARALFIELALEDLRAAADLFRPAHEASDGVDGWVSMEVSPLLAANTQGSIKAARQIYQQAARSNLFVKIPGTPEGIPAIEESIFAGVPINVTLLFSREQYLAAAEAYLRGIERRLAAGLNPRVASVASLFVSRWDKAIQDRVPAELRNRLGIAVAGRVYSAYRELYATPRWQALAQSRSSSAAPAVGQHRDQGSCGFRYPVRGGPRRPGYDQYPAGKDPAGLRRARRSSADRWPRMMPTRKRHWRALRGPAIDIDALALQLQREGAESFVASWKELLKRIADKSAALTAHRQRSRSQKVWLISRTTPRAYSIAPWPATNASTLFAALVCRTCDGKDEG